MSTQNDLPKQYKYLLQETIPHIKIAASLYGVKEMPGSDSNPQILGWAQSLNPQVGSFYKNDGMPWCGIFAGYCLKQSGYAIPSGYDAMRALKYVNIGTPVEVKYAVLGDIAIKERDGGGHVTFIVAEDITHYHCLGGNQNDQVCIVRYLKEDFKWIRRPVYSPADYIKLRRVVLSQYGMVGGTEV